MVARRSREAPQSRHHRTPTGGPCGGGSPPRRRGAHRCARGSIPRPSAGRDRGPAGCCRSRSGHGVRNDHRPAPCRIRN
ncbi:MAG TPA: hypothetical protein DGG94_06670 [Micromonosporaceae bacterium]|nr:hypothetical protein [Micromonosporaceae bacterium]